MIARMALVVCLAAAPLPNVHRLNERLISGGSPEGDEGFAELGRLGVRTVISVDGARPDVERARAHGLRYVHVPVGYDGIPRDRAWRIARAVRDLPGPIYVHCHHGKHRGPAAAATALRCLDASFTGERAAAFLVRAGTDPQYRGLHEAPGAVRRPTKDELDRVSGEFQEVAPVGKLTRAMADLDERLERLGLARGAGWRPPAKHPDIDPPHEALQLAEHFREAARLPDAVKIADKLIESAALAGSLEKALRRVPGDAAQRDELFRRVERSCRACHALYRN